MKTITKTIFLLIVLAGTVKAQNAKDSISINKEAIQIVEASCGQCNFKLEGQGCNLAVRIAGKAYFVDGTSIDEHGDAHAKDGFCSAIRKAEVKGEIVDNRFKSSYFKLLPLKEGDN